MTFRISATEAAALAVRHVSAFNGAVAAGDYGEFLQMFTDDAVVRFENVPGAGTLEFTGRDSYTAAYREQPPDDEVDLTSSAVDGDVVIAAFRWHRDGARGTMRLTFTADKSAASQGLLVSAMTVIFG